MMQRLQHKHFEDWARSVGKDDRDLEKSAAGGLLHYTWRTEQQMFEAFCAGMDSVHKPERDHKMSTLTDEERIQIAEVLNRRACEIATFCDEYKRNVSHFGSVELALTREIDRLQGLAEKIEHGVTEP